MVDATDLVLLATLVQTAVITLTLIVFIFQFRSQEKAIKEASYQSLMGRYNEYIMSSNAADDALLARLFTDGGGTVTQQETGMARRQLIAYGIIEEAYELYAKGWIDKDTWDQWDAWLKVMCRTPRFGEMHYAMIGMFDKGYQDHVTEVLKAREGKDQAPATSSAAS